MSRLQAIRDLDGEGEDRIDVERLATDALPERAAEEPLHFDEGLPLEVLNAVYGADVGVVQGAGRAGFAPKTLQGLPIAGGRPGQELESHPAPELRVLGLVDDAHAALPERFQDVEAGDGTTAHGRVCPLLVSRHQPRG